MRSKWSCGIWAPDVRDEVSHGTRSKRKAFLASLKANTVFQIWSVCNAVVRVLSEPPPATGTNDLWPLQLHNQHVFLHHPGTTCSSAPTHNRHTSRVMWLLWHPGVASGGSPPTLPGLSSGAPAASDLWFLSPLCCLLWSECCVHPNVTCWHPNPTVLVWEGGGLGKEALIGDWVMRVEPSWLVLVPLQRRLWGTSWPFQLCEDIVRRQLSVTSWPFTRHPNFQHLDLGLC